MKLDDIDVIISDFDGVMTDNRVWIDQEGRESVVCNRSDGMAIAWLHHTRLKFFILSAETNPVVAHRGLKLRVPVVQGVVDKERALDELCNRERFPLGRALYLGNDLNDLRAMRRCGFCACPADSHPRILEIATFRLRSNGGAGVIRELVEEVLGLDGITEGWI